MTFLGLEARTDLPKVPYPTALDFFVFLSFGFIFATIIQFALVHYFTKYGSGECYFSFELSSESSSDDEDWNTPRPVETVERDLSSRRNDASFSRRGNYSANGDTRILEVIPLSAYSVAFGPKCHRDSWTSGLPSCLGCPSSPTPQTPASDPVYTLPTPAQTGRRTSTRSSFQGNCHRKRKKRTPRFNSVSKIDRASRIVFPICFFVINVFYWYAYLQRSERIKQHWKTQETQQK